MYASQFVGSLAAAVLGTAAASILWARQGLADGAQPSSGPPTVAAILSLGSASPSARWCEVVGHVRVWRC